MGSFGDALKLVFRREFGVAPRLTAKPFAGPAGHHTASAFAG